MVKIVGADKAGQNRIPHTLRLEVGFGDDDPDIINAIRRTSPEPAPKETTALSVSAWNQRRLDC